MAQCVALVQDAGGLWVLTPDNSQSDISQCSLVVQSGDSVANGWLTWSPADALTIVYAMLPVIALAWGFRVVIQVLRGSTYGGSNEGDS